MLVGIIAVLVLAVAAPALAKRGGPGGGRGAEGQPVVYVTGQGLYYDSIITADNIPNKGPFQKLEMGPNGLQTEFGPGDQGYVGGRWWLDNPDMGTQGVQDAYDTYFLCPLLGPGRAEA